MLICLDISLIIYSGLSYLHTCPKLHMEWDDCIYFLGDVHNLFPDDYQWTHMLPIVHGHAQSFVFFRFSELISVACWQLDLRKRNCCHVKDLWIIKAWILLVYVLMRVLKFVKHREDLILLSIQILISWDLLYMIQNVVDVCLAS